MRKEALTFFYERFKIGDTISKNEIKNYLEVYYKKMKNTTLEWRLYDLRSKGYISNAGNNNYTITDKNKYEDFKIDMDKNIINFLVKYNTDITNLKRMHPGESEVNISVWNTILLNKYTTHQVYRNFTIIEIDKYRTENLFFALKRNYHNLLPSTKVKEIDYLLFNEDNVLIIEKLPKRSPLMNKRAMKNNYVTHPKAEKILVDILVYNKSILPYDYSEIKNIYKNIFKLYRINKSTLLNYARVRGVRVRTEVEKILKELGELLHD